MLTTSTKTVEKRHTLSGAFKKVTVFTQLQNCLEAFGHLTQLCAMHGCNPYYFNCFHIDHDPACICEALIPTDTATNYQDHILHSCEAYKEHRHTHTNWSIWRPPYTNTFGYHQGPFGYHQIPTTIWCIYWHWIALPKKQCSGFTQAELTRPTLNFDKKLLHQPTTDTFLALTHQISIHLCLCLRYM